MPRGCASSRRWKDERHGRTLLLPPIRKLEGKLTDAILWDAKQVAAYLGQDLKVFARTTRHTEGFPPTVRPWMRRWLAADIKAWTPKPAPSLKEKRRGHTTLYRHYSQSGELLYVGISLSATLRTARHKCGAHWFKEIATITLEHFDRRRDALKAERRAIKKERPLHNLKLVAWKK